MKRSKQVGDRVAVYNTGTRFTGTVSGFRSSASGTETGVTLDDNNYGWASMWVHEKQCRLLKPKGLRSIWIYPVDPTLSSFTVSLTPVNKGWIEFVEKRPKKK